MRALQDSDPDRLRKEVDGLCVSDSLSIQLKIHANDTVERKTLSDRFHMPRQLTAMLLLEGDIRISINETTCHMSARHGPVGYVWLLAKPGSLVRHIQAGKRIRKVNVTVPLETVERIQLPQALRDHIRLDAPRASVMAWAPSPHALRCAQEILTERGQRDSLHSLSAYVAGLSMLQQALHLTHECLLADRASNPRPLIDRDMARAARIRECILTHTSREVTPPQALAKSLGMSVSTLQRVFKAAYGMSVMEFQRSERLKAARAMLIDGNLTVGEAGFQAGYSTVSNFSCAFQRAFGYPPSACMRR